jgi:hypothetical protein
MENVGRYLTLVIFCGLIWYLCETGRTTSAIVLVGFAAALALVSVDTKIDALTKLLNRRTGHDQE